MGTTVINSQMKYVQNKDLGFNKDQLLSIFLPDSAHIGAVKHSRMTFGAGRK
jgi:hypothetical protein